MGIADTRGLQARHHAVCLTGLERSFAEIGANIREGLFGLFDEDPSGSSVVIFGIKPQNATWTSIHWLLPIHSLAEQLPCWSAAEANTTFRWMHCDFRLRRGDCRLSFLQSLCDQQQCEALIAAHEQANGRRFDTIVRLRADLFWEAALRMPFPLLPNVIYVPAMDTPGSHGDLAHPGKSGSINDHLAFGEREAMGKYLTRMRHIGSHDNIVARLNMGGSEQFLAAALRCMFS